MEDNHMKQLWREACGETPPGFINRLHRSLGQASTPQPQRRLRLILSASLALVLLLNGVYALERLGVLDTLNAALRTHLLPEATDLLKSDIPQSARQPALAHFSVEEAVYDGRQAYFTLRVQPSDPAKTLLMDVQADPSWAYDWQDSGKPYEGESFAQKAQTSGQQLVQAEVWDAQVNAQAQQIRTHHTLYQNGDILYTLALPAQGEEAKVQLNLLAMNLQGQADESARGTLDFTLQKSPHIQVAAAKTPLTLPESGLTLTLCQVETTPIASYLILKYALAPNASPLQAVNFEDGLWPEWLDGKGERRESGDPWNSLIKLNDGSREVLMTYSALQEMPQSITLSFYNSMSQENFAPFTLPLIPKEEQ
ncbi:MAG: hypothetical protein PHP02_08350 [Eubacteriales bacterium]|nr:hypothetical protein [Eubacteriales bacterium]